MIYLFFLNLRITLGGTIQHCWIRSWIHRYTRRHVLKTQYELTVYGFSGITLPTE